MAIPSFTRTPGQTPDFWGKNSISLESLLATKPLTKEPGVPVVVRMLSFIKTEVNVSREVGMLDESLDGNQKS